MALPLLPVAGFAMRYGAVALAGYALARRVSRGRHDQRAEDVFDDLEEGVTWRRNTGQANTTACLKRVVRIGSDGPGIEIELSALGRFRIRKVQ